jgi:hypothetical protein
VCSSDLAGADLPTGVTVDVGLPYSPDPATIAQTQPSEAIVKLPAGLSSVQREKLMACVKACPVHRSLHPDIRVEFGEI